MSSASINVRETCNHFVQRSSAEESQDSFKNAGWKKGYEVGRVLTYCTSLSTAKVVQNWKEDGVIAKVRSVLWSFLVAIGSPLGLVGFGIRHLCSTQRNPFHQSIATCNVAVATDNTAITWNVALGPRVMAAHNGLDFPEVRADKIADEIIGNNPSYVCLQEVYDHDALKTLTERLTKAGYNCFHSFNRTGFGLDSGLFTAIRKVEGDVLKRVSSYQYEDSKGDDRFCNKGFTVITLERTVEGKQKYIRVVNTHLQATYDNSESLIDIPNYTASPYANVRNRQLKGLVDTLNATPLENATTILCGDMNFRRGYRQSNEYDLHMATLSKAKLMTTDLQSRTFYHENNSLDTKYNEFPIDHILTDGTFVRYEAMNKKAKVIDDDSKDTHRLGVHPRNLSDHIPVYAKVALA